MAQTVLDNRDRLCLKIQSRAISGGIGVSDTCVVAVSNRSNSSAGWKDITDDSEGSQY